MKEDEIKNLNSEKARLITEKYYQEEFFDEEKFFEILTTIKLYAENGLYDLNASLITMKIKGELIKRGFKIIHKMDHNSSYRGTEFISWE